MMQEMTFPEKIKRHRNLDDISYMALVGMKSKFQFPCYSRDKADMIVDTVCKHFGETIENVKGAKRLRQYVVPRQIAMFFLKKYTNLSLKEIGLKFGDRDHTTVLHSARQVNNLMDCDEALRNTVQALEVKIQ